MTERMCSPLGIKGRLVRDYEHDSGRADRHSEGAGRNQPRTDRTGGVIAGSREDKRSDLQPGRFRPCL